MPVNPSTFRLKSKDENDMIDITDQIAPVIKSSNLKYGTVTVCICGPTATLTTTEYEPGAMEGNFFLQCLIGSRLWRSDMSTIMHMTRGRQHSNVHVSLIGSSLHCHLKIRSWCLEWYNRGTDRGGFPAIERTIDCKWQANSLSVSMITRNKIILWRNASNGKAFYARGDYFLYDCLLLRQYYDTFIICNLRHEKGKEE